MENYAVTSVIDIVALLFIFINLVVGLVRGAIREILNIVGLITAWVVAGLCYQAVFHATGIHFGVAAEYAQMIWFVLLLMGCWALSTIINQQVDKRVAKSKGLSCINRLAGGVFGVIKAVLVLVLLCLLWLSLPPLPLPADWRPHIEQSSLLHWGRGQTWILKKWREIKLVQDFSRGLVQQLSARMLPEADEVVQAKIAATLNLVLQDPTLLQRWTQSPTACKTVCSLQPQAAYYFQDCAAWQQLRTQGPSAMRIRALLSSKALQRFLADPQVQDRLKKLDLDKIKQELGAQDGG